MQYILHYNVGYVRYFFIFMILNIMLICNDLIEKKNKNQI